MNMIYKVLFLGSGNISPINIICKNLLEHGTIQYQFDGLNMYDYGYTEKNPYLYLTNNYIVNSSDEPKEWLKIFKLLPQARKKILIKRIIKSCASFRFKKAYSLFKCELQFWNYILEVLKIVKNYDVVNVQFLHHWSAEIVPLIPKNIRVVISFWGSDLMATSGVDAYKLQFDALQRADAISIFSTESQEILLSKFGRELLPKSFKVFYGLTSEQFLDLSQNKEAYKRTGQELLAKLGYNVNDFKYIFKVGYSSFPGQNHLKIIEKLELLSDDILNNALFIFPLTYGDKKEYPETVRNRINQSKLNSLLLTEYLSGEEAKSISFISNIMLNLRTNDGFNNSMLESLLSGAIVLSGSWLPYSLLRQHNVYYCEVNNIEELRDVLSDIISDFENHLIQAEKNKEKLASILDGPNNAAKWEKVLIKEMN